MDDNHNDTARQDAPTRDEPRQTSPPETAHFTMTVEEVSTRFADSGLPRSVRSIQRYCQRGHLTCTTVDTEISEMYLIDPNSVERRIKELQQIENISRASGLSRQDAPGRDKTRHDAMGRDTSRQDMPSERIESYEQRIKELEEKAMHLEIDKRAKEQIINMLKDDRETLFVQVSDHVRKITDQARIIGQLETRLELGPGRVTEVEPATNHERGPAEDAYQETRPSTPPVQRRQPTPQPARHASPDVDVEHPPRYGNFRQSGEGDNLTPEPYHQGVQ